jgi:alkylation response protein AidB-like acyl-CoA dehydrogenase
VELRSETHLIRSDDEAILIAQRLAAEFALEASERDQKRRLPYQELERSSRSGIWGITVPREYGGADVSARTLAEVIATISAADPSLGHHEFLPSCDSRLLEARLFPGCVSGR